MRGILFDVNIQGLSAHWIHLLTALDLVAVWDDYPLITRTVADLGYPPDVRDRLLWGRCQAEGLVLITENRKSDEDDSLERTIGDSLTPESLPVLTLANKRRFQNDRRYGLIVAEELLNVLADTFTGKNRGVGRLYLPSRPVV